ncbi:hypothetical protein ATK17_2828 [Branchiibius hedensis]|uniref:CopC domain-containing protein n=1 Tax=Branchiibius hedensis TaxID=672460 RepID=A0A2Y8ZU80_9MICO|nr:copper resistance CopC family protein [Branchiibius hedensis]PWJ26654.1 hypothetical protein ATK17_2828 [Branchiibius hedensis]SSA35465.1 hypothetical protein SAMN04489750_2828 [Branchiibius hedensis]
MLRTAATRSLLALIALLVLPVTLLAGAPTASAHDRLVSSNPADGSTVSFPKQITLTFNESVASVGAVIVVKSGDQEWQNGVPKVDGRTVTQQVRTGPAGSYTVAWRVTSADGHPISGQFSFTGTTPTTSTSTSATTSSGTVAGLPGAVTSPGLPTQQKPTDSTNNAPWIIAIGALAALIVIGLLLAIGQRRLKDDEPAA